MTEIQKVHLEPARNAAHYELTHQIQEFAEDCATVQTHMSAEYNAFKAAVEEEGRILAISLRSNLTELLDHTDHERDWVVTGSKAIYSGLQYDTDPAIAEAARVILTQFESLKVNTNSNYIQETGEIDILLSALFGTYSQQVETCNMQALRELLKRTNDRMHDLLNERDLAQAARVGTAMDDARRETDATYRAFIKYYNAWILINATTATEEEVAACELFATQTNTKIDYFKRYVLKQTGTTGKPNEEETEGGEGTGEGEGEGTGGEGTGGTGTGGEGAGSGEGGSETQEMVTITFHYHDGREVVKQYPKGTILSQTTLEVPEHSPGYTWGNYHMPLNYDMTINEYNPNEL